MSGAMRFLRELTASEWRIQVHAGSGIVRAIARNNSPFEVRCAEPRRLCAEVARLAAASPSRIVPRNGKIASAFGVRLAVIGPSWKKSKPRSIRWAR